MEYLEKYKLWLEKADSTTREELGKMSDEEIKNSFERDMEFGTGGIRGIIGAGTNRLNIYTIRRATKGFADYILDHPGAASKGVVIAHDNRRMSDVFAKNTAGVLAAMGIKVFLFPVLHTTPQLSFAVRYFGAFGGVVITASHNPPEYNGYKLYDETGCQLVPQFTDRVIEYINRVDDVFKIDCQMDSPLICFVGDDVDKAYYDSVCGICSNSDLDKNFKIVYSPQHGTGAVPVVHMLKRLGYDVYPVEEQMIPDPEFSNTKNPNPESAEAFELPISYAEEIDADLVIVTDPDCDRLGTAVKTENGFVRLTGNQSGAIIFEYILKRKKEKAELKDNLVMISTIVTSDLGDRIAAKYGVGVEKTLTGFKFIGERIHEHELLKDAEFVFGYEESYGCLIGDFVRDKDGVQASVMLCEAAAYYKKMGLNLVDVMENIYRDYGYTLDFLQSVTLPGREGSDKIQNIMRGLREELPEEIGGIKVKDVEDYLMPEKTGIPKSNVLKLFLEDGSWIAVRPSGTEPKCKFYYSVFAKDNTEAESKLSQYKKYFESIL